MCATQIALDLEVSVNGKRLKQGPFTTNIRPPRLSSQKCYVFGDGTRGAEPGEEKVLVMQLVNELEENVTSCGSLATISGQYKQANTGMPARVQSICL